MTRTSHVIDMDDLAPHASQTRKVYRSCLSILVSGRLQTGQITNLRVYMSNSLFMDPTLKTP